MSSVLKTQKCCSGCDYFHRACLQGGLQDLPPVVPLRKEHNTSRSGPFLSEFTMILTASGDVVAGKEAVVVLSVEPVDSEISTVQLKQTPRFNSPLLVKE